ncbi:secreted insulinase-like peptidase [Cryptosporidium felis]|nr:secreted insulinase-like peptidase [Cryptosporidium felis]
MRSVCYFTFFVTLLSLYASSFYNRRQLGGRLSFGSFIELLNTGSTSGAETYKFVDSSKQEYFLSHVSLKNGIKLLNVQQAGRKESKLRVILNRGTADDPEDLPGVGHFSLFLLTKRMGICLKQKMEGEPSDFYTINVGTHSSTLTFKIQGSVKSFFKCLSYSLKFKNYLDSNSSYLEMTAASIKFEGSIESVKSIDIDKLIMNDIYYSKCNSSNELFTKSELFSYFCHKKSLDIKSLLPRAAADIISKISDPSMLTFIFIGDQNTATLTKILSGLTKGRSSQPLVHINERVLDATKVIGNTENTIFFRNDFHHNTLKLYIPFITEDLELLSGNSHLFVMSLLNSDHRGGILNFLLMNEFASGIHVGYFVEHSSIKIYLQIALTLKGSHNIPLVIDSVFSYFNIMKKTVISDEVFRQMQTVSDHYIGSSIEFLLNVAEMYYKSHNYFSASSENILKSDLNTNFSRSLVERFISSMRLESAIVSFSLASSLNPIEVLYRKLDASGVNPKMRMERFSNVKFTVFEYSSVFPIPVSDLSPFYGLNTYGLELPHSEPINLLTHPKFVSEPLSESIASLHNSLDIHAKHLADLGKSVTISQTMGFKSLTTSRVLFSNNSQQGKNVKLDLKFSLRQWSPLMEPLMTDISPFSVMSAMHIMTAIINQKFDREFSKFARFGSNVKMIPTQTFYDAISDPFELFLSINIPTYYLTYVLSEVSIILNSFDQLLQDPEIFNKARIYAKRTLYKEYVDLNQLDKDIKVITQLVSSQHCSFKLMGSSFDENPNRDLVKAVFSSIFAAPSIFGFIQGNLTPFHANHALNVFIESINHSEFYKEPTPENIYEFLKPVSSLAESGKGSNKKKPGLFIETGILDISTVPPVYMKMITQKLDFTVSFSSVTVSILVGTLEKKNYLRAALIREVLNRDLIQRASAIEDTTYTSNIAISANGFISVLFSIKSKNIDTGSLTKVFYEKFKQSMDKGFKIVRSKAFMKQDLATLDLKVPINKDKILLSRFDQFTLMNESKLYMLSLSRSEVAGLYDDLRNMPILILVTQKVSNLNTSISSVDYIPEGFTPIGEDYKVLLDDPRVSFLV